MMMFPAIIAVNSFMGVPKHLAQQFPMVSIKVFQLVGLSIQELVEQKASSWKKHIWSRSYGFL